MYITYVYVYYNTYEYNVSVDIDFNTYVLICLGTSTIISEVTNLYTWFSCSGSTELCGTDKPQQQNGVSAWIWSPRFTICAVPSGSIIMSTVTPCTLSEGGQASITPPLNSEMKHDETR